MRKFALALAACAGIAYATPAMAEAVQAQNPSSVMKALRGAGYPAKLTIDNIGDPLITSSFNGSDFSIYFYGCTDNEDCRTIQFYAGYANPQYAHLEALNEWNKNNRFGRAYLSDDGAARIEMDLDIDDGGISTLLFEDNLEFWLAIMSEFEQQIVYIGD